MKEDLEFTGAADGDLELEPAADVHIEENESFLGGFEADDDADEHLRK